MHISTPNRKQALAMAGALILVPVLFQAVQGGDVEDFLMRLLISAAAVIFAWRGRVLASMDNAGKDSPAHLRRAFAILFWVAVAAALLAGFRPDSM
jgi:Ser/Thr protein kinase RdoA (MazF antagonist)